MLEALFACHNNILVSEDEEPLISDCRLVLTGNNLKNPAVVCRQSLKFKTAIDASVYLSHEIYTSF